MNLCGAPMPDMVRGDGSRIEGARYHCTDRFCDSCARKRAQRTYASILAKLQTNQIFPQDDSSFRLVTLTLQKRAGLSADQLWDARARLGAAQNRTHEILREHDYCVSRWKYHAPQNPTRARRWKNRALQLVRSMADAPQDASFGLYPASGGQTTYIWARELTLGRAPYGWHLHVHYLVPTAHDGERLVAAWAQACGELGEYIDLEAQKISEPRESTWTRDDTHGGDTSAAHAASYVTHYITKGVDDEHWTPDTALAYISGIYGMRQYDAAGRWRPLGIGRRRPDADESPVVRVEWPLVLVDTDGELSVRTQMEDVSLLMGGRARYWSEIRRSNQYRTNLRNQICSSSGSDSPPKMLEIIARPAILDALERPGGKIPPETRRKFLEYLEKTR